MQNNGAIGWFRASHPPSTMQHVAANADTERGGELPNVRDADMEA